MNRSSWLKAALACLGIGTAAKVADSALGGCAANGMTAADPTALVDLECEPQDFVFLGKDKGGRYIWHPIFAEHALGACIGIDTTMTPIYDESGTTVIARRVQITRIYKTK